MMARGNNKTNSLQATAVLIDFSGIRHLSERTSSTVFHSLRGRRTSSSGLARPGKKQSNQRRVTDSAATVLVFRLAFATTHSTNIPNSTSGPPQHARSQPRSISGPPQHALSQPRSISGPPQHALSQRQSISGPPQHALNQRQSISGPPQLARSQPQTVSSHLQLAHALQMAI
jgi:hypothetical protein